MTCIGRRLPDQTDYVSNMNFLLWNQFPAVLDNNVKYFEHLTKLGVYKHMNPGIRSFMDQLMYQTTRQITIAGVGSLIDMDKFGNPIKRPSPQNYGTSCSGSSLCVDSTCFNLTEGLVEANNIMNAICWSLNMPCLKDMYYSDSKFEMKMRQYFDMFFKQPPAVVEAFQRTTLLREAIKVVCTDTPIKYTGPVFGGTTNLALPYYFNPADPTAFPDMDAISAGIGGANLSDFIKYILPRMFSGSFRNGMEDVAVYGLMADLDTAMEQTASVSTKYVEKEMLSLLRAMQGSSGSKNLDIINRNFINDSLFPTFKLNAGNVIEPIVADIMEPSTIAGYIQSTNPEHPMAKIRGLLLVPSNWKFNIVEPPVDNFSFLGMGGNALDFTSNTPGVRRIMSSSMFTRNTIGPDGTVIVGQGYDDMGMVVPAARGLVPRDREIREAVRTDLIVTHTPLSCSDAINGQLPNVARPLTTQGVADGFALKSTIHIGRDVVGSARPILLMFRTDAPRAALPIEVCSEETVTVDQTGGNSIVSCCPGGQVYAVLTFSGDVSSEFSQSDTAVYRVGGNGASYLVTVTAVSGSVVTIQAVGQGVTLPCCSGDDQYGTRAELINTTGITATSAVVMKALCTDGTPDTLALELFTPIASSLQNRGATLTLCNGQVIDLVVSTNSSGVFISVQAAGGETCNLCELDCSCLVNSTFTLDPLPN